MAKRAESVARSTVECKIMMLKMLSKVNAQRK